MHTHYFSATHFVGTALEILLILTGVRLIAGYGMASRIPWVRGVSQALYFQA